MPNRPEHPQQPSSDSKLSDAAPPLPSQGIAAAARMAALRRFATRSGLGLQGRVIFCFFALLTITLGATVYVYFKHSTDQLADLMGEQARQLSSALAMSVERPLQSGARDELMRTGRELIKSRNVLFVGFFDVDGQPIAVASRDADIDLRDLQALGAATRTLMQARYANSSLFGQYVETVAPVLASSASGESRLVGYVAVGVSQESEAARLKEITRVIVIIAFLAVALSVLVGSALVHRLFHPIRALVAATHQIISGDLDTRVDIERKDVIGQLARAFNEMVIWVKKQQRDLAAANHMLLEANRDLEVRIAQRTAQLETANNRLSTEIAEKEAFLRAVSHDLNAPLRNIDGMATMLLMKHREKLDEDVVHRLERIKKNVEMETGLITELLELSRIKSRRQKMEMVDIDALVRQLADVFEEDLRSRDIELLIESPLPVLECERARLRQVFQNLVDNAIKYMGEPASGKPRQIRVGCALRNTEAEFFVRDTGIGIEADEIDKVFQVFRRGRTAQASNVGGKGVGLASVRSIVETYNGRIWVESKLGHGSTFKFTINGRYVPAMSKPSPPAANLKTETGNANAA
jgi:signal transduction histidine kinase